MRVFILFWALFSTVIVSAQIPAVDTTMVFVKGGAFEMGNAKGKRDARPVHVIKLNDFYIGRYEVTQQVWRAVMGSDTGSQSDCTTCPVYSVSWQNIQMFLARLNHLTGKHYRVPTEAEWEYAATGAAESKGYKYCGSNDLNEVAWYDKAAGGKTHPVGMKKPNELGLFDMSGNVWEICSDWYKADYYKHSPSENPEQKTKTKFRVTRGGSWRSWNQRGEARARNLDIRDHHIQNSGFRLVREVEQTDYRSWVDSMDNYARDRFLPATKYHWTWQNAALLNVVVKEYDKAAPQDKLLYFNYIKTAMDKTAAHANGHMPNAVASGLGMAFLYRVTKDEKYKQLCDKIYTDYLHSKRTTNEAVSHIPWFTELWDDTVFMIGEFLIAMYRATGDEKYLDELAKQIELHRAKLQVKEWGLWVHGWDQSDWGHCLFCSEVHWSDKLTHRSAEMWGRGNGWILVTLADALQVMPESNPHKKEFEGFLTEMIARLPELQDKETGHWYQLPVRKNEPGNFIESSCTAMFAYGIEAALRMGLVNNDAYKTSVELAYKGLRKYSMAPVDEKYLTSKNVCRATCIGHKQYYFRRGVQQGKAYGLGSFMQFGLVYEHDRGYHKP